MKNFLQVDGAVSVPAPRAILSGGLVVVSMLAGVAQHSAATITNNGTTPINTLRHERQLDVILRAGASSAGEETAIRDYRGRVFA